MAHRAFDFILPTTIERFGINPYNPAKAGNTDFYFGYYRGKNIVIANKVTADRRNRGEWFYQEIKGKSLESTSTEELSKVALPVLKTASRKHRINPENLRF